MYLCPKCEEEIPNRVKKTTDECPFCHEPWPPEITEPEAAAPEEHKQPEGWGDEFVPSAPADPSQVHRAEPKKSKTLFFVGGGVAVVAIAAVVYFVVLGGGKKEQEGGTASGGSGGITEADISAADGWYKDVRKKLNSFIGEVCAVHHGRGYKYNSHFHKRVTVKTVKGQKIKKFDFELRIQPAKGGKAEGALNMFECPVKLAEIHRDHPIVVEARIWEHRKVFGGVFNKAEIQIKGKMVGHLEKKRRTVKHNVVLQNRSGFAFSRMKSLPKEPRYEGYRTLSTPMKFYMAKGLKSFRLANLTWKKIKPGRYIQGTWRLTLRTNEFHKQLKDWDEGCFGFRKRVARLDKPKPKHTFHLRLTRVERKISKQICSALHDLAEATKGEQTDSAGLSKARTALSAARARWNKEIYGVLKATAKKKDSAIHAKSL